MAKGLCVLSLVLCLQTITLGQSSGDLAAKYHQITSYELRPSVLLTPKYSADGQVCEMVLEKRQKTDTGIVFGDLFSEKEVHVFVDELVPDAERGRNLTSPLNITVDGGFMTTEYKYENVLVRVYGTTRPEPAGNSVITITWRKRTCIEPSHLATAR
jgi:hypothetical protein